MEGFGELQRRLRAGSGYKWWVLGLVMLGTFMAVLDVTVVNVGIPTIMSAFHIGISSAEWIVTAYMITMTIMLPSSGWIADRFGNKRFYIVGLALFTLGSGLCAQADSDAFLIGARALQGVGSGIIQSLGLAIVTREFPPQQRGLALGLWAVAAAASISFGPLIGGYLVDDFSWHLIFDVNVPIGILAIALSAVVQKEWKSPVRGRFDWAGFVSIALFMPLSVYGLAKGNSPSNPDGWASPQVIGCFVAAAVALAVFIAVELRHPHPLLNIRLLGDRHFGVAMTVLFIFGIGMLGGTYLLPLYMQKGLGYTAVMAGSVFLPVGLIQGILSTLSGFLTRYLKILPLVFAGVLVMSLSFYLASRFTIHTTHGSIMWVLYLRGFGMGLTFAPLNLFSLKNLSLKDMAAASGIANSVKQLSGSIGIAMLTAIMTSRTSYHAARESLSSAETFVGGITDDFGVVCLITLASLLPFLLMLVKRRTGRTGTDVSK
nr:DHA2 family efflux MFS transporter permease subunit [uncultured Alistipes sp.]